MTLRCYIEVGVTGEFFQTVNGFWYAFSRDFPRQHAGHAGEEWLGRHSEKRARLRSDSQPQWHGVVPGEKLVRNLLQREMSDVLRDFRSKRAVSSVGPKTKTGQLACRKMCSAAEPKNNLATPCRPSVPTMRRSALSCRMISCNSGHSSPRRSTNLC